MSIINIYHGDSTKAMKLMKVNQYGLANPDPPYGIGAENMQMGSNPKRSRNDGHGSGPGISTAVKLKKNRLNQGSGKLKNRILNQSDCSWDIPPPKEYFDRLLEISQHQIIWGGNYFDLPPTRGIICWDKIQPWENFSQFELAWTSFDIPARMFRYSNTGGANKETKIHPTQKPVKLYKWTLKNYGFYKDGTKRTIIDTHAGSMSIVIACIDLGFDIDVWEKSESNYNAGVNRVKNHLDQLDAFREPLEINYIH